MNRIVSKTRHRKLDGFTLVELLVVITIIGVLISLLLPAVQAVRESARLVKCQNNLKQIGLACLMYEEQYHGLPPASMYSSSKTSGGRTGWVWMILPFLEQKDMETQFGYKVPWYDSSVRSLITSHLPVMECPSDPIAGNLFSGTADSVAWQARAGDYFSILNINTSSTATLGFSPPNKDLTGAMQDDKQTPLFEIKDGTSCTMMIAEMAGRPYTYFPGGIGNGVQASTAGRGAWAHNNKHTVKTYTWDGTSSPGTCPLNCGNDCSLYGFHPGGANGVFVDGSVRLLPQSIDLMIFFGLMTRNGGEIVNGGY
jgi:prepilin-type N-terminal cleavage/methylation domain-containing protein/prepilin-type processing-associated H-X9-DG protein